MSKTTDVDETVALDIRIELMAEAGGSKIVVCALAVTLATTTGTDETVLVGRTDNTRVGDVHGLATVLAKTAIVLDVDSDASAFVTVRI